MGFDFVVLGATGMQGKIVTKDLLKNGYSVLLCGRDKSRILHILKEFRKTSFECVDLTNIKHAANVIKKSGAKVVVNCAEGDWNFNALKACIEANVNLVDLGSDIEMTKKQLEYDKLLKSKNLIHITGCGSVPGVGNVMLKYAARKFDSIDSIDVGFVWDSNMKKFVVPFSILSVIEEFVNPAPVLEDRKIKYKVPLDNVIELKRRAIERQKCFLAEHSETYTFYKYFKRMGLKNIHFYSGFPNHSYEKIMTMIELGLGSKDPLTVCKDSIRPVDFLTQVLKRLGYPEGYTEKENLWVYIYGKKKGQKKEVKMECLVFPLKGWEDAGCNIDTGMPASIMAQMIKENVITEKGSFAPEGVVPCEPFFEELKKRKMIVLENGRRINK